MNGSFKEFASIFYLKHYRVLRWYGVVLSIGLFAIVAGAILVFTMPATTTFSTGQVIKLGTSVTDLGSQGWIDVETQAHGRFRLQLPPTTFYLEINSTVCVAIATHYFIFKTSGTLTSIQKCDAP